MRAQKFLMVVVIALAAIFMGFQMLDLEIEASGLRALLVVSIILLYWVCVKQKRRFFFAFLVAFALADILSFISWLYPPVPNDKIDFSYYIANTLYILSYTFLIIQILKSMRLMQLIKRYPLHTLILIVLDVFSVIIVTNTAIHKLSFHEYYMELVYNSVVMVLLTVSLLNYIHKEDKKAINLLIGAIFIFFSEVIQSAYFYISDHTFLNVMCSLFLVLALLFFYLQSNLDYEPQEKYIEI